MIGLRDSFRFILLSLAIAIVAAACAGKDKPTPADVEKEAFNSLRTEVASVITDPERLADALEVVTAIEALFDDLREHLLDRKAKIKALNADYDANRADFVGLYESIQSDMARNQQQISALHRKLMGLTTVAEWEELSKEKESAMEAVIQSIQSI